MKVDVTDEYRLCIFPGNDAVPESYLSDFFRNPIVHHRKTRDWPHGGQRHWFAIEPGLTRQQIRLLFDLVPVGASLDTYDPTYDSPSEVGAWITFRRYPDLWTATFRNHGWSSDPAPVDLEDAALIYWETYDIDSDVHMPGRRPTEDAGRIGIEHISESGLDTDLPGKLDRDPDGKGARFLRERVASIRKRLEAIDG